MKAIVDTYLVVKRDYKTENKKPSISRSNP